MRPTKEPDAMPDIRHDIRPDIRIDKEGIWYYRGMEMFRKDIVHMLYQHVKQDPDGRYLIEKGEDRVYLDVEDTPYVVKSVLFRITDSQEKDVINLLMPDDRMDELDPATLRIGADNALYGVVVGFGVEARFARSSYYQLAKYIEFEAGRNEFYICLNGCRYYIRKKEDV